MFPGVGCRGPCVEGGLRDPGAGSLECGGRQGALGQTHGRGLGLVTAWGPPTAPVPPSRTDSSPTLYFRKFTGCGISAQSHWRCVLDFFLSFQIFFFFFKQSYFFRCDYPERSRWVCACPEPLTSRWEPEPRSLDMREGPHAPCLRVGALGRRPPPGWNLTQLRGQVPCPRTAPG